jgi:nitrite reductase (NADH) small subunit
MSALADIWVEIGRAEDVPRYEGRRVTIDGERIAVFRTDDGFHALAADCPHAGGPLQDGLVADGCVTCPLHGWRFELSSGAALSGGEGVRAYEVAVRNGRLLVAIPAAEPSGASA